MWLSSTSTELWMPIELSNFVLVFISNWSVCIMQSGRPSIARISSNLFEKQKWISHSHGFLSLSLSLRFLFDWNWIEWSKSGSIDQGVLRLVYKFFNFNFDYDHNFEIRFLLPVLPAHSDEIDDVAKTKPMWKQEKKNWFELMFPLLFIPWNTLGITSCWLQHSVFFSHSLCSLYMMFFRHRFSQFIVVALFCWKNVNPVVHFGHIYRFNFQLSYGVMVLMLFVLFFFFFSSSKWTLAYFMIDKFSIKTLEFRNKFRKFYVNVRQVIYFMWNRRSVVAISLQWMQSQHK